MTYSPCRGTNLVKQKAAVRATSKAYSSGSVVGALRIRRKQMFSGNLIDELIAIVVKVEQNAQKQADEAELERWYSAMTQNAYDTNLLGVA